jgi:tripartite-type tricarboxylate transporter receptor subunit TctC
MAIVFALFFALVTPWSLLCVTIPAAAQDYPNRPIVIVVPFAAGGGNDVLARLLAQHMSASLRQQIVIENRPGAGGTIGARAVAKAPPTAIP